MRQRPIARYSRRADAQKYANDLARAWTGKTFAVVQHPHWFAWTVALMEGDRVAAYVARRNRRLNLA